MKNIAIIGDFDLTFRTHQMTNESIMHSSKFLKKELSYEWISTDQIENNFSNIIQSYKGFWIAPGSPYKSMKSVLQIIEFARLNNMPTFGTCGGFQHMAIEFARNVLNIKDAQHAEYDPYASKLIVTPLTCNIKGQTLEVTILDKSSKVFSIFERERIYEKYYCNFGLNPKYQQELDENGFRVVGIDAHQEARILELKNHPFFIATLFVPQDNSTQDQPHKLVTAFLKTTL
jgi:CTP synthase (UTP-ammonia lyase)